MKKINILTTTFYHYLGWLRSKPKILYEFKKKGVKSEKLNYQFIHMI